MRLNDEEKVIFLMTSVVVQYNKIGGLEKLFCITKK
jgi:hypothetical protein